MAYNMRELTKTTDTRVYTELKLEFHVDSDNLTCTFYKGRKTKPNWNFRFKTLERLEAKIQYEIALAETTLDEKAVRKQAQLEVAKTIKVGDIFRYSWGWEQTNVDFYQVISRKGKSSLVIRPIGLVSVRETSWGSDEVIASANDFLGDEETVRLNGDRFKRSCGSAYKVEDINKPTHRSWYA